MNSGECTGCTMMCTRVDTAVVSGKLSHGVWTAIGGDQRVKLK